MFLKDCWYVGSWTHELEEGKTSAVQIIGQPIVLFRGKDGAPVALENRCPHRHAPLALGALRAEGLRCPYHGLVFDEGGACVGGPAHAVAAQKPSVRAYPAVEQGGWIWIWMGSPDRADESLIPSSWGLDDPRWRMKPGTIDYEANYQLVNDNLCDLTHVDFVHETTLSAVSGGAWSQANPNVSVRERGLRLERWFVGVTEGGAPPDHRFDKWSAYDYLVPGVFVMENKVFPHGVAEACNFGAPDAVPLVHRVEQQAVTPIDERRTRYFFATGFDPALKDEILEKVYGVVEAAFAEDRRIIEAQQKIWDITPDDHRMTFLPQDKAPEAMRRIIRNLIKAESGPAKTG